MRVHVVAALARLGAYAPRVLPVLATALADDCGETRAAAARAHTWESLSVIVVGRWSDLGRSVGWRPRSLRAPPPPTPHVRTPGRRVAFGLVMRRSPPGSAETSMRCLGSARMGADFRNTGGKARRQENERFHV